MRTITPSILLSILIAAPLAGCVATSSTGGTGPSVADHRSDGSGAGETPAGNPGLSADGRFVATERLYKGDCAPAGTRGGCHTITLLPDGSYRNFLYDAVVTGSYEIKDGVVTLKAVADGVVDQTLPLSADLTMLGEFVYQPAE